MNIWVDYNSCPCRQETLSFYKLNGGGYLSEPGHMWITLKQKNRQCALESRLFFLLLNPKFIDLTVGWVWLLCLCRQNHYKKLDNQRIEKFHFYISGRSILHPLRSGNQIEIYQRNQKDNSDWLKFFSNREHPFLSFQKISWF